MYPWIRQLVPTLLCLAFFCGGPADAADDSRFRIPTAEFRDRIKRVGLLPVFLVPALSGRDEVKAQLEEILVARLNEAGLEVVRSASYTSAFDAMNRQVGGIYSAADGTPDLQKLQLVEEHARNAFIDAEALDATVTSGISVREARFTDWTMYWDGVTEASTGPPVGAYTKFGTSNFTLTGRLPVLSFGLQIEDRDGQVAYLAWGGVQPVAYREAPKGVLWLKPKSLSGILNVPIGDLLRDQARLKRAVEIASRPLLPGQDASTVALPAMPDGLLPLPPGQLPVVADPFKLPRENILARVKSVAILPVSLGSLDPSQTIGFRYDTLLESEIEKLGWRIASAKVMDDKRRELASATSGFHDVFTGALNTDAQAGFRRAVMTAGETVDAVVWPLIVERSAESDGVSAYWDGTGQHMFTLGPAKRKSLFDPGLGGVVNAASLRVEIRAPDDTLLFEGFGGIQILERPNRGSKEALTSLDLFTDPARDDEAVRLALRPLVLTPEQLAKESREPAQAPPGASERSAR